MSQTDERETFEAKWPTPAHCKWIGNGYAATEYNAWSAHTHIARWEGWQARAAIASQRAEMPQGWREQSAGWLRQKADEQERINSECPAHAAAYPSWTDRVRQLRWLAEDVLAAAPQPPQAEQQGCADANDLAKAAEILRSNGQVKLAERLRVAALTAQQPRQMVALTDEQIEKLRESTFSTNNPFCPVDSKSMRKAVRAAERAHGIAPGGKE